MSSLLSSVISCVGASVPVLLLAGLLWATATVLDTDSSYSPRKRTVPGGWDSHDDEHLLFVSPPRHRHSPSVTGTVSSALTALIPLAQRRSFSSTSSIVSCSSPCPVAPPNKERPSARASSTGVSQTSTPPQIYSHLTSSQNRSTSSSDEAEAVRKALRKGSSVSGRWSRPRAIDRLAGALVSPGHKIRPTVIRSGG